MSSLRALLTIPRLMTSDRGSLGMALLLALAAVLMISFPAQLFECDAVIYACAGLHNDLVQSVDAGHLVWGFLEMAVSRWSRHLSPPLNPLYVVRWLAVGSSLVGAWLVFRLLAGRLRIPGVTAALLAGTFLFSYAYWHFGLQGEPHASHTLALIVFLLAAWAFLSNPAPRAAAIAGLVLGLATLLHQTTILLLPAVLAAIALALPEDDRRRVRTWWLLSTWFLIAYVVAAIVPYLLIGWFVLDLRTVADYRSWIMGLSEWGSWGNWRSTTPVAVLIGIFRAFTGSHYLLGIGPVRDLALRLFPNASWDDELLLASAVLGWIRWTLILIQAALFSGATWLLVRAAARMRVSWRPAPAFGLLLSVWIVILTVFFAWWAPERAEFWVAFWLPFLVLVSPAVVATGVRTRWLGVGVAGLLLVNLLGSVAPQANPHLEPATLAAVAIDPAVAAGDILLTDLPLGQRAGGYVYALDIVISPADSQRSLVVADSLRSVADSRGNTLYWVSARDELPRTFIGHLVAGARVPVRYDVVVRPLH